MKEASYHLTLLAKNRTGFRNLIKLASAASSRGLLFQAADRQGVARTAQRGDYLSQRLRFRRAQPRSCCGAGADEHDLTEALEVARWFHNVFGDRYFIEIQNNGIEIQRLAMEGSVDVAEKLGLPLVATSDAHYADREDAEAQDVMLCINTGKFRTDTNRMQMDGNEYFIRSPEEMYEAFPDHADAVARSQEIADRVDIDLELGKRHFPTYTLPQDKTAEDYLRELCLKGLKERYAEQPGNVPGWRAFRSRA